MFYLDRELGTKAVYGGWFLGGGGGGSPQGGLDVLESALQAGRIEVRPIDNFDPAATILTASLVGSPSTGKDAVTAEHCRRAYDLFMENSNLQVAALISNESGAHSITNGWIAAAVNGLPILDAACNGRAHPTGVMGAMGLDSLPGYTSVQVAVGGAAENRVELCARGSIQATSKLVREASTLSGGFITVLRNPVDAAYVKDHAGIGTLSMCIETGVIFIKHAGKPEAILAELQETLGCRELLRGRTAQFQLTARGGFDVGSVAVCDGSDTAEVTFWNEYMTVDAGERRLATFPDLIALLNAATGEPICSSQIEEGLDVIVVCVPAGRLLLSSTMFDRHLFLPCEEAVGKEMIRYAFDE